MFTLDLFDDAARVLDGIGDTNYLQSARFKAKTLDDVNLFTGPLHLADMFARSITDAFHQSITARHVGRLNPNQLTTLTTAAQALADCINEQWGRELVLYRLSGAPVRVLPPRIVALAATARNLAAGAIDGYWGINQHHAIPKLAKFTAALFVACRPLRELFDASPASILAASDAMRSLPNIFVPLSEQTVRS